MFKWYKDMKRRQRFEARVRAGLPNFHPETGARLEWAIRINNHGPFNPITGERIRRGLSSVSVSHCAPLNSSWCRGDYRIFNANYRTGEITPSGLRWIG